MRTERTQECTRVLGRLLVAPISGARIHEEWHKAGKPALSPIFVKGQHGFSMKKQNLPSDAWINLLETWLANQGFLPLPVAPAGSHP